MNVSRTDTLPTATSTDVNDPDLLDLEGQGRRYDLYLESIKRYLYRETREVEEMSASATDENAYKAVLRRKRLALEMTETLIKAENALDLHGIVTQILLLLTLLAIIPAVLLNLLYIEASLSGAILLYAQSSTSVIGWGSSLYYIDKRTYARLRLKYRAKNRSDKNNSQEN